MKRVPFLVASLAAMLGWSSALVDDETVAALFYEAGAWIALISAWVAVQRIPAPRRRSWLLVNVALTLWVVGDVIWDVLAITGGIPAVSVADAVYMAAYVVFTAAVFSFLRRHAVGRREALLDGSAFAASVAALMWIFLVRPRADVETATVARVVAASYPLLDVLLIAALMWLVLTPGRAGRAKLVLVGAMAAMTIVDVAFAAATARGSEPWLTLSNSFYPATYGLFAAAVILAGDDREDLPASRPWAGELHAGRALLLGFALLLAPAAAVMSATGDAADRVFLPIVTTVVSVLVLARFVFEARARERIHAEILVLASRDPLTGLANRRAFVERLTLELGRGPCAVLYIDLDRLKWLNDSMGHSAGDGALVEVGRRLLDSVRQGDFVGRLGGDEFAVCCPALTDHSDAQQLAARVLAALDDVHPVLSASVGLAIAEPGLRDPEGLLRDADYAMYRAKHAGGNRVARA